MYKIHASGTGVNAVTAKLKELFTEHRVPDVLNTDHEPQYASATFADLLGNVTLSMSLAVHTVQL